MRAGQRTKAWNGALLLSLSLGLTPWATGAAATHSEAWVAHDAARLRDVPLQIHAPEADRCSTPCPVVLFATGYRAEVDEYRFLLQALAAMGYLAVGVQLDLPSDDPMPRTGNIQRDRQAHWQRGLVSLRWIVQLLAQRLPQFEWKAPVLAGHSQGGDVAALLASAPDFPVRALLTLDHRRVPLPRNENLPILSLRSADQVPDPGVLPSVEGDGTAKLCVVTLRDTRHDDMNQSASPQARERMVRLVEGFLLRQRCGEELHSPDRGVP